MPETNVCISSYIYSLYSYERQESVAFHICTSSFGIQNLRCNTLFYDLYSTFRIL